MITKPIALGCEVDETLRELYRGYDDDKDVIRAVLRTRFREESIQFFPENSSPNACWNLHFRMKRIHIPEAKKARLTIAIAMGLFPAFSYEFLPEYDREKNILHHDKFLVLCRYHRTKCVRPSHLILCTTDGHRVPTLLSSLRGRTEGTLE